MARKKHKPQRYTWSSSWWHDPPPSREQLLARVEPLLVQIRQVDQMVAKLVRGEGRLADLIALQHCLSAPFTLKAGRAAVSLAQPAEVRLALSSLSRELHLEVHAVDGQYPSYLLCRVSTDWDAPDVVLEDLHVSPVCNDFFPDERFTILMRNSRSRTFLRLAPFRERFKAHLGRVWKEAPEDSECDELLTAIAKLVLQSAWYEDQRLPFAVADTFGLRTFRCAGELVAFILGSDLYHVASGIEDWGEDLIDFFLQVYENPYLAGFLDQLNRDGLGNRADLERAARETFEELNRLFSAFLSTTDALRDLERLELYKIVLGCFGNLREVAGRQHWTPALEQAVQTLETASASAINRLVQTNDGAGSRENQRHHLHPRSQSP